MINPRGNEPKTQIEDQEDFMPKSQELLFQIETEHAVCEGIFFPG